MPKTPYEEHPDRFLQLGSGIWVRLLLTGERYGKDGCLIHDQEEPVVEFYDGDYDFEPWLGIKGQFISRYYLSTVLEHTGGLDLHGGEPKWRVDAQEFWYTKNWLQARYY